VLGERVVVHGRDLHQECMGQSYVGYTLFCVTGRSVEATHARVLEEFWIATGYADPRIWCNRIAGYLASARVDPGLSLSAALAASDSLAYGFGAMRAAYRVQAEIPGEEGERGRWLTTALDAQRVLHGYGRPLHGRDERIARALQTLADQGLTAGPALRRAFWLDTALRREKGIGMNIAGVWAATAIDFRLSEDEYAEFMLLMFVPGYLAVYADQRKRPAFSFLEGHQSG
jgi:citrate synthase